jgi:four helix bundle protein
MAYRSFEELEVWKRASQLAVSLYQQLEDWKDYSFRDQMQRAVISIASNIAEGSERGGKDFVRFLRIASGSAAELRTQVYIAQRLGRLPNENAKQIINETKEIAMMLVGLARSLKTDH